MHNIWQAEAIPYIDPRHGDDELKAHDETVLGLSQNGGHSDLDHLALPLENSQVRPAAPYAWSCYLNDVLSQSLEPFLQGNGSRVHIHRNDVCDAASLAIERSCADALSPQSTINVFSTISHTIHGEIAVHGPGKLSCQEEKESR